MSPHKNPADPGVLVLSKFAGAANELDTALLVNPHVISTGMARTVAIALSMPLTERRMRWEAMMVKLRAGTIQRWFADFVDALQETHLDKVASEPLIAENADIVSASLGQCRRAVSLEHDPEKLALGLDPGVVPVFPEEIMLNKKIERDDDSKKSHSALSNNTIRHRARHSAP